MTWQVMVILRQPANPPNPLGSLRAAAVERAQKLRERGVACVWPFKCSKQTGP
jgi:hypothetical protein